MICSRETVQTNARSSSREARIRVTLFSVVYLGKATLPHKKVKGHYSGPRMGVFCQGHNFQVSRETNRTPIPTGVGAFLG